MSLRVVGAGLGRTGTLSLKLALERLLGGPCYHMAEVFGRPQDIAVWRAAARGERVDWEALFDGYVAAVDWPASAFWRELADIFPEAPVLLSHRPAEAWWKSASSTIFPTVAAAEGEWRTMLDTLFDARFTLALDDQGACMREYEAHNQRVRRSGLGPRLFEWQAGDGWEPLCAMLGVPVPDEPFPHANSTAEFQERLRSADDDSGNPT